MAMTKEKLIEELNQDLAAEISAIVQYLQHGYLTLGKDMWMHDKFESVSKDEMKHAEQLAERIVAMGGVPTVKPNPINIGKDLEERLSLDIMAEEKAMKDYREHIKHAEEIGEWGTSYLLQNILLDEQNHWDLFVKMAKR